jgi:hypothetical protein
LRKNDEELRKNDEELRKNDDELRKNDDELRKIEDLLYLIVYYEISCCESIDFDNYYNIYYNYYIYISL